MEFKLSQKEVELLQALTYTDEGHVNLLLPKPLGNQKTKTQLGLIETGLFDYIIGSIIQKKKLGRQSPENVAHVKIAHSLLKKFLGEGYSLISFEPR